MITQELRIGEEEARSLLEKFGNVRNAIENYKATNG
jgi:hypothetical protein